jgi:hypothetical protein
LSNTPSVQKSRQLPDSTQAIPISSAAADGVDAKIEVSDAQFELLIR